MANIILTGSAMVVKSSLKLETLTKLAKYKPASMELRDEKDRLIFKVAVAGTGDGSISEKALYFAPATHDPEGLATITAGIPYFVHDAKDYVADLLGAAYPKLVELEDQMATASAEVDAAKEAMLENISVQ